MAIGSKTLNEKYNSVALFYAMLYAAILCLLPVDGFMDRISYLHNYGAASASYLISYFLHGPAYLLSNEPIWLLLNIVLSTFLGPENIVRCIVFFSAFLVAFSFLRLGNAKVLLLLVLLVMPFLLKNFTAHLRQGLGIGVFVSAFLFTGWRRWFLFITAPLIHSSFFFILLFYLSAVLLNSISFRSRTIKWNISFISFLLFASFVSVLMPFIISSAGARQGVEIETLSHNASGIAFIFWAIILIIFLLQSQSWIKNNIFSLFIITFYLLTYFKFGFAGRIFESGLFFVILSALTMQKTSRMIVVIFLLMLGCYQWIPTENSLVHLLH